MFRKQVAEKVTRRQIVWVAVCWAAALSIVACGESRSDGIYLGESVTLARSENSRLYVEDASEQGVLVQAIDPGTAGTCGNLVFVSLDGKVSSLAANVFSAVLSPAGRAILSADGNKVAYLANEDCAVQWSPDGTAVLLQETAEEIAPAYLLTSNEQVHRLGEVLGRGTIWRGSLAYSQSENEIFVTVLENRPTPTGELDDIARTLRDTFREPALLRFEAVD